ncbi:class I glutamine amidotransferase-like protein [Schizophyllum amplum]|uniref:Class I glutamine amidotransferase-like protein n=1 Tax=Schizophyllum amplum TaxID=97359 RepID=A0A550CGM0_9AGAR|nr:class I glutamine amidotransferase-like protein [Auriculariopsis ampla]
MSGKRFLGGALALLAGSASAQDNNSTLPVNFGMVLFPSFQAFDVFGPLDALNVLSMSYPINLYLISSTLDPVSTAPRSAGMNPHNSNFSQALVPTHTFEDAPALDVLMVPGGLGTRAGDLDPTIAYIADAAGEAEYVLTVCTGSWLAARAGVLDGKNATSNKASWAGREGLGNGTNWIAHARWVEDGNVWTSSGISAGIDMTLTWMESVFGNDTATSIANKLE